MTVTSAVKTGASTISKARYVHIRNQHNSAAATVNGASLSAGGTFELPLLPEGQVYPDIAVDGSSSSLFCTAIFDHHSGGMS